LYKHPGALKVETRIKKCLEMMLVGNIQQWEWDGFTDVRSSLRRKKEENP